MSERQWVVSLLERWRAGDESAAEELYRRYAERLWTLAERHIGSLLKRRVGPDDILQSVFRTFFRRAREGSIQIDHTGSVWRLLVKITLNKIRLQAARHRAARRDVGREASGIDDLEDPAVIARDPTPSEAAALAEELEQLCAGLKPLELDILRRCLEGESTAEIAAQVGCSRWTVRRFLDRVGGQLRGRLVEDPDG